LTFLKKRHHEKIWITPQNQIVDKLQEFGYFKYAAEEDIPEIKHEIIDSLTKLNYLGSASFDTSPYNSKDCRHYHFDGEDLFEEGGFVGQLQSMKTLLDKMNFKLQITKHIEDWDNDKGLNHSIMLNGKDCIIFKNFNGYGLKRNRQTIKN